MSRHECKYWQLNLKYNYRYCGFCGRYQYNYGGVWKDRVTLEQFIDKYSHKTEQYDVFIHSGSFFEYNCYESWGAKIMIQLGETRYGPFPNLNCAMWNIDKELAILSNG